MTEAKIQKLERKLDKLQKKLDKLERQKLALETDFAELHLKAIKAHAALRGAPVLS